MTSSLPAVSVVIPTYNHGHLILETLESVFAQTFSDYEIIVINDGSPDNTADILRPLALSGKIKYIEQPNAGQASARNRGIQEAQGEYLALLDDDDSWPADKLEWQVKALKENPDVVLVYGNAQLIMESVSDSGPVRTQGGLLPNKPAPSGWVWEHFLGNNYIHSPGQVLMRRKTVQSISGFDSRLWGTDDYDLYLRLAKIGQFLYKNQTALLYLMHANNASNNILRHYKNVIAVRKKHLGLIPSPANFSLWWKNWRFIQRGFNEIAYVAACTAERNGNKEMTRKLLFLAIFLNPAFLRQRHTYYLAKTILRN